MKVLTTDESHYVQYENGFYDPGNYILGYYDDLLRVFDRVILVGRCKRVGIKPNCQRVDNDRVEFFPVPDFSGYMGYIGKMRALWRCRKVIGLADRYWLRSPGFMASMIAFWLQRAKIPFFVRLVGDPAEVADVIAGNLPRFLSSLIVRIVRKRFTKLVKSSSGVLANTRYTLQRKYPSSTPQNDFGVTTLSLPDSAFNDNKRNFCDHIFKIITVGALLEYKGHDYLLKALGKLEGIKKWQLLVIGQGPMLRKLKFLAERLGIGERILFLGRIVWGPKIFEKLDESHLFVLSSVTEGMPRVVIEAMARALPVISTDVGGVHEILQTDVLVPPKDVDALANKIVGLWNSPQKLAQLSCENFQRAQEFRIERVSKLRRTWFRWMRDYGDRPKKVTWPEFAKDNLPDYFNKEDIVSNKFSDFFTPQKR